MHAMATCHRGTGFPIERDIDLHVEDLGNDNESIIGLDTTIAIEGQKTEGHPNELIPSNQAKLTALMRE